MDSQANAAAAARAAAVPSSLRPSRKSRAVVAALTTSRPMRSPAAVWPKTAMAAA